jgi:hypothetical protein
MFIGARFETKKRPLGVGGILSATGVIGRFIAG